MVGMISTLDKKNNSNLTVSNGKVMDNGLNYTILGVAMPGMYESLNLSSLKNTDTIEILEKSQISLKNAGDCKLYWYSKETKW